MQADETNRLWFNLVLTPHDCNAELKFAAVPVFLTYQGSRVDPTVSNVDHFNIPVNAENEDTWYDFTVTAANGNEKICGTYTFSIKTTSAEKYLDGPVAGDTQTIKFKPSGFLNAGS